jgi:transposase
MTRLKVHNMAEGGVLHAAISEACHIGLRSVERILGEEAAPTRDEVVAGEREDSPRRGRRPKADQEIVDKIVNLLKTVPDLPAMEVLRLSKSWGYEGGRCQMSELVRKLRPVKKEEPVVRFEGLPGEYTQYDFGQCEIRFEDGTCAVVNFFAARLKYSRYMHVELVPNQTAEILARALLASLVVFGGSTKEWVFDNPRTVRISPIGVEPVVLHRYLRQLVAEYRVIPTLCAPRSGNQKGSVERLVGYVKNSFLRVRKFKDMEDLRIQLAEWLHEVNEVRPSDATGEIPALAREKERPWFKERPVRVTPDAWAIQETATVTPMGTISYKGTSYSATARCLGAPATLFVRKNAIEIRVGSEHGVHAREDGTGEVRRLPQHREAVLSILHGRRKSATFRRQCLLELGKPAWQFLEILVHRCPDGQWEKPCHELYDLLCEHGDGAMQDAMIRCVARRAFTVNAIRQARREAA